MMKFQPTDNPILRILVGAAVPPDPNAGASGTVYQMNRALRRIGHVVDEIWQQDLGRWIRHGNLYYLLELPWAYRRVLKKHLASHQYDVIEFNQPHSYLASAFLKRNRFSGVFVNRSHGHEVRVEEALRPWRSTFNSPIPHGLRGVASRCIRHLLDRQWEMVATSADGFHVSCTEDSAFLIKRYRVEADRIGVISQGIPKAFVTTPAKSMSLTRLRRLLYVGQWSFVKAPMIVAQTVVRLLEARPELQMTWVCAAANHVDVRSLLSPAIQQRVTLLDWRPQDELLKIYDDHGLFLFPSFFEGFGKTPLEAMSRGMCVIASNTGGMRDFINDGISGVLVEIGHPDVMVRVALSLIDSPRKCEHMSAAAREAAVQYTWDRCAQDLTHFYHRLMRCKNQAWRDSEWMNGVPR